MPATQEMMLPTKIALIAGGGMLPDCIIADCDLRGVEVFVVGFEGQTSRSLVQGRKNLWTHLGAVGKVISILKENGIKDIVMAGSIKRPSFFDLRPDWKAAQIIARLRLRALGDNALLEALRQEFEKEGFCLHGIQKFSDRLIAKEGVLGDIQPEKDDEANIKLGVKASQAIGALDIGQAVIVQQGMVIGVEAVEGTDALITRCAGLLKTGRGGILIKTCKPQQDRDMDLPTIGVETVIKAHGAGLCGIVVHAGQSVILDAKSVAQTANEYKIFVLGVSV